MKKLLTILLTLAMVFSLAACGGAAEPATEAPATEAPVTETPEVTEAPTSGNAFALPTGEPVELTWGSWAFADPAVMDVYQSVAAAYNETNPYQIAVDTGYSFDDYLTTLLFDAASGTGPDIAQIPAQWLPQLLELGVVRSLNGYIAPEVLEDFSQGTLDSVTVYGELVALPWYANTQALLVNTELCARAEVDPAAIASWEDLMAAAEKIGALNGIYGLGIPNSGEAAGEGYHTFPVLWAQGGGFEEDGQILLESDEALKAYSDLKTLFRKEISPRSASLEELRELFASGKLGFYWDTEAAARELAATEGTQVIPFPGPSYLETQVLVVLDSCTDEKMAAVGHFLEYLSGAQAMGILREKDQAVMSGRSSVMAEVFADCTDDTMAYAQAMETARALPTTSLRFQEIDALLSEMLRELAKGGDPAEILVKWDSKIQDLYNE